MEVDGGGVPSVSLQAAWENLRRCFGLRQFDQGKFLASRSLPDEPSGEDVSRTTLEVLRSHPGLSGRVCRMVQADLDCRLREDIAPAFWRTLRTAFEEASGTPHTAFSMAVVQLRMVAARQAPFVRRLQAMASDCAAPCSSFGATSYVDLYKLMLRATLHSQMPGDGLLEKCAEDFYDRAFRVFYVRQKKNLRTRHATMDSEGDEDSPGATAEDDDDTDLECAGCNSESDSCHCEAILTEFHQVSSALLELDALECLAGSALTHIVHSRVDRHVADTCTGSFSSPHLGSLEDWLEAVVVGWMRLLYTKEGGSLGSRRPVDGFRRRLQNHLYETYAQARIDQLFNIIIEFPESQPALEDLHTCLERTAGNLRSTLTSSLRGVLQRKLLHLGVSTTDILTAYVAAIRALRVLDPGGVVLELVCEPVRKYLRTRDDTVRCIVQSLIDDSNSELSDELKQNEGLCLDESFYEEEDMTNWESWCPDPSDADPDRHSQARRTSDIISMLVNIYGSKELFINEYRAILSNRLLSHFSYETEKEIRNLELLKLRFGEAPLHQCEVMLKDISDSKRINTLLHASPKSSETGGGGSSGGGGEVANEEEDIEDENVENREQQQQQRASSPVAERWRRGRKAKDPLAPSSLSPLTSLLNRQPFQVNAIILSAQFWPQLKEETLELPSEIRVALEAYTRAFEAMKGNRTLVWKPHLGFANIDLEIGSKKLNLTVSPVHAAIIYQFQLASEWQADQLARALKIPLSSLRRRIAFWQAQGLIRERSQDLYCLVEEAPMRRVSGVVGASSVPGTSGGGVSGFDLLGAGDDDDDEAGGSVTRTSKDRLEEDLQVFWSYITNMLINLDSLSLETIFRMLKMFAMQGGVGGGGGGGGSGGGGAAASEYSIDVVRQFLDKKVREHELVFVAGQYKLPPKN